MSAEKMAIGAERIANGLKSWYETKSAAWPAVSFSYGVDDGQAELKMVFGVAASEGSQAEISADVLAKIAGKLDTWLGQHVNYELVNGPASKGFTPVP